MSSHVWVVEWSMTPGVWLPEPASGFCTRQMARWVRDRRSEDEPGCKFRIRKYTRDKGGRK